MKQLSGIFICTWIVTSCFFNVSAQENPEPGPPFLAHSSSFVMTLFNLNDKDVQVFLPKGIKAKLNNHGMITAGLEIYETDRIHGIPKYAMAFIFVEVEGLESNNGTPGHWAIWGKVNEKTTLQSMLNHFNFPYGFDEVKVTKEQSIYTATVGSKMIELKLRLNDNQPFSGEGIVNMCSMSREGKIIKTEVPWFTTGSAGELISMDVNPQGNKILEMIKNAKPVFSIISSDQTFSYSRPMLGNPDK